jgi:hypothetical protein
VDSRLVDNPGDGRFLTALIHQPGQLGGNEPLLRWPGPYGVALGGCGG